MKEYAVRAYLAPESGTPGSILPAGAQFPGINFRR